MVGGTAAAWLTQQEALQAEAVLQQAAHDGLKVLLPLPLGGRGGRLLLHLTL